MAHIQQFSDTVMRKRAKTSEVSTYLVTGTFAYIVVLSRQPRELLQVLESDTAHFPSNSSVGSVLFLLRIVNSDIFGHAYSLIPKAHQTVQNSCHFQTINNGIQSIHATDHLLRFSQLVHKLLKSFTWHSFSLLLSNKR